MNMPSLPDWLPWWVPILVAIPLGLWILTMLIMPFSVIGVKSRLEAIEERLDEVQSEIRTLVLRLPQSPAERVSYKQDYYDDSADVIDPFQARATRPPPPAAAPPPIPPQPRPIRPDPRPDPRAEPRPDPRPDPRAPSPRSEPRFDWRR